MSIIRYYGGNANLEKLVLDTQTTKEGVNAYNLIECAKKYGFDSKGIKTYSINNINLPFIAHLNINKSLSHFICVYEIKEDYLLIMDPSCGFTKININKFNSLFSGNIIILTPKHIVNYENKHLFKNILFSILLKNKKVLFLILLINIICLIFSFINNFYLLFFSNYIYIIIFIIFFLINCFRYYLEYVSGEKINKLCYEKFNDLNNSFYNHTLGLPLDYIHVKDSSSFLVLSNEIDLIKDIISNNLFNLLINTLVVTNICIIISLFNIKFICLIFTLLFINLLITIPYYKKNKKYIDDIVAKENNYNLLLVNIFSSFNTIKHNCCEKVFYNKIKKVNDEKNKSNNIFKKNCLNYKMKKNIINIIFQLTVSSLLFKMVNNNEISYLMFIIMDLFFNMFLSSIDSLIINIEPLLYFKKIFIKLDDHFDINVESMEGKSFINGDINISNLSFKYNINNIFENYSLVIKKNEKVIVKGKSGCGKSTLFKIIVKEYLNYDGLITIGDTDLSNINIKSLRENISYSSQNERIICGTIKENICMFKEYNDERFNKICKLLYLDKIILGRPFQYDTFLYGGGEELSGGERQLIYLARVLIRDFKILILDESLSELDYDLEKKIIKNIFSYYKDKTIIYITHNESNYYNGRIIYM